MSSSRGGDSKRASVIGQGVLLILATAQGISRGKRRFLRGNLAGWLRTHARAQERAQGRTGAGPTAHPPPGPKKFQGPGAQDRVAPLV